MEEPFALAEPLAERSRGIFAIARRSDFDAQEIAELSPGRPVAWTALSARPRGQAD
jgi:hypothetical protein